MDLEKGLEILVQDWRDLHEDGGTPLSVEEVVANLGLGDRYAITPEMKPGQIAELIINALRRTPGSLENVEKFMAQFESAEELLEEIDLDCLVSDLSLAEEDL
ncbi:MAG TPA: hypothetical protein VFG19_11035 [Geobacteraceae bacterium]|nr:hypothetical protein [Geobacteraceae bacterium]